MTLSEARKVRDEIRALGIHCTVPLGMPRNGFFAKIFTDEGEKRFYERETWEVYKKNRERRRIEADNTMAQQDRGRAKRAERRMGIGLHKCEEN